jgi:hypothetical protein
MMKKMELAVLADIEEQLTILQAIGKRNLQTDNRHALTDLSPTLNLSFSELKDMMGRERLRSAFLTEIVNNLTQRKLIVKVRKDSLAIIKPFIEENGEYGSLDDVKARIRKHVNK